ncbi:hypothetical protein P12x_002247 [Tundrisphaera lichenicola]|uniref:hypothetical protein n=1 Tax=Tundrisphaera lichenicola TaxID=2029860 RepID=UPI003EB72D6E
MKRPRFRGPWLWLGLMLLPALAWAIVLIVAPTEWARARMVARFASATGRVVQIGAIRLGVLGNLRILDLSLAERSTPDDPWLRVAEARVDVHLGEILFGSCDPGEITVEGASVRFWRRRDGTLEVADLFRASGPDPGGAGQGSKGHGAPIRLKVAGASLRIVDEPSETRFDMTGIEAEASCDGRVTSLDRLKGIVNGGSLEMAAKFDRNPVAPHFELETRANGIGIDEGMPSLAYLVPVVAGATDRAGGKLGLILSMKGQGTTRDEIRRTLRGQGSVLLDPIDLDGSKFLDTLDAIADGPRPGRVGSVSADLTIGGGRIASEDLTIRVARFPLVLGGWTDFDGRFDYAPNVDQITAQLPSEARVWISELKVNFDQLAGLRLRGTPEKIEVTVHGHPLTGEPGRPDDDRARFRETARLIRDRFFR